MAIRYRECTRHVKRLCLGPAEALTLLFIQKGGEELLQALVVVALLHLHASNQTC